MKRDDIYGVDISNPRAGFRASQLADNPTLVPFSTSKSFLLSRVFSFVRFQPHSLYLPIQGPRQILFKVMFPPNANFGFKDMRTEKRRINAFEFGSFTVIGSV